ncbi:MAG TPA: XRE family transcriptional regulator [Egibacteraceae bacterium]|nr:XRE family transcriptional regulator [Egibacteraceae bacterium]
MPATSMQTSGVAVLDALIDGVRVGDNLVVMLDEDVPADWLVDRYIEGTERERLIVADSTGRHGRGQGLDWSAAGVTSEQARSQLAEADEHVGPDAAFAIDSLDDLADRWGDQAALDLFLWACPRLFRRRSVALWVLRLNRHDDAFVRRLTAVTQVVVTIHGTGDDLHLDVVKADGRDPSVAGRSVVARLVDGDLVDARPGEMERQRLGDHLRELRAWRGVGQAELARKVGISPSALSQAERGVRAVSAETLMRIWEALGVGGGAAVALQRGFRVHRRGAQPEALLASGVTGQRRTDGPAMSVWQLTFTGRANGRAPLFAVKTSETVVVLRGVLQVELQGAVETLHEGDTLVAHTAAITAWANPADTDTEVLWILGSGS